LLYIKSICSYCSLFLSYKFTIADPPFPLTYLKISPNFVPKTPVDRTSLLIGRKHFLKSSFHNNLIYRITAYMEYDNDRLRRRTTPTETTCWILVVALNPLTDCIAVLHLDVPGWCLAFLISGIAFPLYLVF